MKKKIIEFLLFFIYIFTFKESHAIQITDANILKEILECNNKETIKLEVTPVTYCKSWYVRADDNHINEAKNITDANIKIECNKFETASLSKTNISDNLGFSVLSSIYAYSEYKCSNGLIKTTNSCAVYQYTSKRDCRHSFCSYSELCGFFTWCTYSDCSSNEYRTCKNDCWAAWDFQCSRDHYDYSSTKIDKYDDYIVRCNNPSVKNKEIYKIYDPNMLRD